ncbi:MAG: DUF4350 domain-containing protein [Chloroflexi bacterium]|nr:DUF4350 domain-containing protein [Chloroflexota bacterium]
MSENREANTGGAAEGDLAPSANPQSPISNLQFLSILPDWVILLGACVLLAVAAVASLGLQLSAPDGPPLGARAYGITGSVALARWVEELGYPTRVVEGRPFRLPDEMRLLFMLQPSAAYPLGEEDRSELLRWVRNGGTLVLAVQDHVSYPLTRRGPLQYATGDPAALDAFSMTLMSGVLPRGNVTVAVSPIRASGTAPTAGALYLQSPDALDAPPDASALAQIRGRVIAAVEPVGGGRVIALATAYPFTNEGLANDGNARFILDVLRSVPPGTGTVVGFDEYHHGSRQTSSIPAWLVSRPAGQGVLLALALLAIYAIWTGRRLGRVYVPRELRIRRQPSEYVVAMANLARVAGQHNAALAYYRDWLKQRLGRPYRIDPGLDDGQFVGELSRADSGLDAARLLKLLVALRHGVRSRAEFVRLAREASEWG